jgi:ATP-grasp domain/L-amino acid ligase C-terminal domain 2/ATP-grasp N-terminal domain
MPRILLFATTTGYQTRAFGDAAERLGVDLVFATDRCDMLEDPWQDEAIPIRFHDEARSVATVLESARARPIAGVLVVGDRPTVIAARVAEVLGLQGHPPAAAAIARNKQLTRERLRDCGLLVPWFVTMPAEADPTALAASASFPCVVKPLALSGSRGVIRADDPPTLLAAFERLRAVLRAPDVRAERNDAHDIVLVEGFIEGREFALEGLLHHGALHVLALFDKPDPLEGPYFEETIYATPSSTPALEQLAIVDAVGRAAAAIGLRHGPIHAECRVNGRGVFVLEVAARPIGGLCARALRFEHLEKGVVPLFERAGAQKGVRPLFSLEELLMQHALGEAPDGWSRESSASGVMMIPIPRRGIFRRVAGIDEARRVVGVEDVRITAKPDQLLVPLPEGASYLGFIFARGERTADVGHALRASHELLQFTIDPELPVLQSLNG